jgi:hypothetical protein
MHHLYRWSIADQAFRFTPSLTQQQQQQQQRQQEEEGHGCLGPRRWSITASKDSTDASQQLPNVTFPTSRNKQYKDQSSTAGLGYASSFDCWDKHCSSSATSLNLKPGKGTSSSSYTSSSGCYKVKGSAYSSSYSSSLQARSAKTAATNSGSSSPVSSREYPNTSSSSSSDDRSSSRDPLQFPQFSEQDLALLKKLQNGQLAQETLSACVEQLPTLVQDTARSTILGCGSYGKQ